MIKMKKLVSSGIAGANEGHVPRGREFTAANERRARDLEDAGLAYRLAPKSEQPPPPINNHRPSNRAAEAGPLDFPGGTTGADVPVPSSLPAPPRRKRRSRVSTEGQATPAEVKTDLLS